MKFTFIKDNKHEFAIVDLCSALEVSTSGFYRWLKDPVGKRRRFRERLVETISRVHEDNRRVYGSPRVHAELLKQGLSVCKNTVAKLMKDQGIQARTHRRFKVRTTDSRHAHPVAPNLLERRFVAEKPDAVWLTDITYIPTGEGILYLAGVMDMYSRKIVGWSMAEHMRSDLVCDALNMAINLRRPGEDLLHHSDRGVQYACKDYQDLLKSRGIAVSMSGTGDCYDNAPKESFWGKLKTECVYLQDFPTREEARAAIFDYIQCFYNRSRLHSSLGYLSPEAFEAARS